MLNLEKNERSMLAQFRCGILALRIETGRYNGEQIQDRRCIFCDNNQVETETHFLVECYKYEGIRQQVFGDLLTKDVYTMKNSNEKLCYLLNKSIRKTAKYIVKAFIYRRRCLYN